MGQQAKRGRQSSLDNKKERAAGRKQNAPSVQAITDRQSSPPVHGAFGSGPKPGSEETTEANNAAPEQKPEEPG
jgi:hypothetical protein